MKLGALTLNEMRGALGLDPFANAAADRPMVLTPTGYVPIEAGASPPPSPAGLTRGSMQFRRQTDFALDRGNDRFLYKYSPDQPRVPAGNSDGGQWTSEDGRNGTNDSRIISDAAPDNTWTPGAQYAGGVEEGEGENRSREELGGETPAQEARLAVAEARLQDVLSQVQTLDSSWKPTPGLYETVEGQIANLEAQAQQAQNRLAEITGVGADPAPEGGHHYVPKSIFNNEPLPPETRSVFDEASSGPLADAGVNWWSTEHRNYNDAVQGAFAEFLAENEITSDQMTPDQAREFLAQIFRSNDPRILEFNLRIFEERRGYLFAIH